MFRSYKKKILLTAVMVTAISTLGQASSETVYLLEQRIEHITTVQESVDIKQTQALDLRRNLNKESQRFAEEIKTKRVELEVQDFNAAQKWPRLNYNLKLLGRLKGYIAALSAKIQFLDAGHRQLRFLKLQATDELQLARTFDDIQANTLIKNIDNTIQTYEAATTEPLFDIANVPKPQLQELWAQVFGTQ